MLIGVLIGILGYSLILLIFNIYKDQSSFDMIDWPDMVIGGPFCWLFMLICFLFIRPIYKWRRKNHKQKEYVYKPLSEKKIKKTVDKLMSRNSNHYKNILFDFSRYSGGPWMVNNIEGWDRLFIRNRRNQRLNNKFQKLMHHQKDDTVKYLAQYFTPVTRQMLIDMDYGIGTLEDFDDCKEPVYVLK